MSDITNQSLKEIIKNIEIFVTYMKNNIEYFLNNSEKENLKPLDSILTVEVNTTELCNRTCVFCPRHDPEVFPNRNLHLTVKGARIIAEELGENGFQGKISFSGFGENLLNPYFVDIVKEFRFSLPHATLECNTNGDKLTEDYANRLYRAGLDLLYINLYDGVEQMEHFDKIMTKVTHEDKYKYRMHWGDFEKHGLILNNRSGVCLLYTSDAADE